jgi:thiol-disulfide isomerase/thioredoxin
MVTTGRRPRVRAAELTGAGGWLNTGGRTLTRADLRGKIVILDFWTFCCLNCLHVLEELRPLEEKYSDVLVIVGVHSPKFPHEADHGALVDAVARYEVRHPVLDDPELRTWQEYAVRAWPTLVLIDPEGYVVSVAAGEGHAEGLARIVEELIAEHDTRGTLHRGDGPYVAPPPPASALRFPGKIVWRRDTSTYLVSDSGHHSIVELGADGETVLRRLGSGERGRQDGPPDQARFAEPQGLTLLPTGVAAEVGYDLLVADTVNHLLRGVELDSGRVRTVADLPAALDGVTVVPGRVPPVPSPWDVAWWRGRVAVAAAGVHLLLEFDPRTGRVGLLAGTTVEGLRDGPARDGWLAQPSGLAVDADDRLWIVDSETSALRWLTEDPLPDGQLAEDPVPDGQLAEDSGADDRAVDDAFADDRLADDRLAEGWFPGQTNAVTLHTAAGVGLFDFGHVDGPAAEARFQHPLGVSVLPDGSIAVLDTYNGAVRRYDPATAEVTTLATGLAEPSGAVLVGDDLVVVESAAHRITRPVAPGALRRITAPARPTQRPPAEIAPGPVTLEVVFEPAPGQKLDDRFGPSTLLQVSASPPELLISGAGESIDLSRQLEIARSPEEGVLHVTAQAASCDADLEHPACHITRQDWGVPIRIVPGARSRLPLVLRGME